MICHNEKKLGTIIRSVVLGVLFFLLFSCGQDPFKEMPSLKADLKTLDKKVNELYGKNLSSEEILDGLDAASLLIDRIQAGRDEMAEKADRLTLDSYELYSREIEKLKESRLTLYEGIDDFVVCSYRLSDLMEHSRYYHDRSALGKSLRDVQEKTIAMVQRDAPHSTKSSFSYYKNLSKITSQTADENGNWYYTIEVNIGYNYNEKNTQTLLNSSKVALSGIIRSYFSGLTKDEVQESDEAIIKAGLVMALNDYLIQFSDFEKKKMEGVKLVTFDMIQYYEFQ